MRFLEVSSVLIALALAACGAPAKSPAVSTAPKQEPADPSCPVAVAGTSVSVEDAPTGAALVFVTTSDVAELRRRVSALAAMHNDHHGAMGPLPDGSDGGDHAGHDMSGHAGHEASSHAGHDMPAGKHAGHAGGMIGVHSKATASEIEGGAKVTFTAAGADVAKLQSELRMHAQHLASGTCGMKS
jgi:hypothetical protein